jgi:GH35 family endo-1,4-beta-xylanase
VTLTASASGSTNDAVSPHMNLVVADTVAEFGVAAGFNIYQHSFDLPAGTYFVRTEFNNDVPTANRQLTVGNLTISGATTVSNTTNTATNNASALAAADTYIANFRQGPANVALAGVAPGTPVEVRMVRNAFNIGTMVQGFDANVFLAPLASGDTTSIAARYQNFVNQYFNILVPSNMGKWQPNEAEQNVPTMGHVDTILDYAEDNNMNVRMHNLIWGTQQPTWVNTLITNAGSSNPAISGPAKASLMAAIANRISYYIGDGDADVNDGDRARKYVEIDVLNEALRDDANDTTDPPTYWEIYGAQGVAQIYKMVKDAVEAAGANTRLYTNEYNIFQFSDPNGGGSDPYANWYRRNVEDINNAGFGQVVTGIGIQAITPVSQHSPAKIYQVLHNMAVTGLPITLTEFSVNSTTAALAAQMYDENLRLMFGHPNGTSFLIWEAWPSPTVTPDGITTIVDSNWNLTLAGQALVDLIEAWTTPTQNLVVGADGTIDFSGFYGQYEVTVGEQTFELDLTKGTSLYSLLVAPGDYNGNGEVDAADYTNWRDTLGSTEDLRADGNGDRVVDDDDYAVWKSRFGTVYAGGGSAAPAVPEPATLLLLMIGWGICYERIRYRH